MLRILQSRVIRIGTLYVLFLTCAVVLLVRILGAETILVYANKVKPYSGVLQEAFCRGAIEDNTLKTIICFGDSNFFCPATEQEAGDELSGHIGGLLRDALRQEDPAENMNFVEWAYRGAAAFDYYCLFYRALSLSPDLVIIPVNWRAFSTTWIKNDMLYHPELSAFVPVFRDFSYNNDDMLRQRGITAGDHILYRVSFLSLYPIGIKEWVLDSNHIWFRGNEESPGIKEKSRPKPLFLGPHRLRGFFPMEVESSNERLTELNILAMTASREKVETLFFIWPLDKQYLSEIGLLDEEALARSKRKVEAEMCQPHVHFVDLSDLLDHQYFFDSQGHCTLQGRELIARALCPEVAKILNNQQKRSTAR